VSGPWLNLILALAGGFLPALIWLAFWLRQDAAHPEPKKLIITCFCLGAAAVPAALVLQTVFAKLLIGTGDLQAVVSSAPMLALAVIVLWALVEEGLKLAAAYAGGLFSKESDEPIDATVYLVAAALGFASLENVLYVAGPLLSGDLPGALLTGPLRFVGATTLHAAAAACLGAFAGFARFRRPGARLGMWVLGFLSAVALHVTFNAAIIRASDASPVAYAAAWVAALLAIVALEQVKAMRVEAVRRRTETTRD